MWIEGVAREVPKGDGIGNVKRYLLKKHPFEAPFLPVMSYV
jgi:hypothetical protein